MTDTITPDHVPTKEELQAAGINIVLGIPMERTVPSRAFISFMKIAEQGWHTLPHPYGRVDVQRNTMALAMLKHPANFSHILFLDLDHTHPIDIVQRLARWVYYDPKKLVVGGLNFRRGEPFDPCIFIEAPDGEFRPPLQWERGIGEVQAIGFGCILMSRKVFEILPGPWFQYVYQYFEDEIYPSEDIYFSTLCNVHGIKLWCDTTTTSPHLIDSIVDEDVFRHWIADHPQAVNMYNEQGEQVPLTEAVSAKPPKRKKGKAKEPEQLTPPSIADDYMPPMLGQVSDDQ